MRKTGHKIYVTREKRGLDMPRAFCHIRAAAMAALDAEGVDEPCVIYVLLTDDKGIHAINLEYRGVDRATDVLSFPQNVFSPGAFDGAGAERDMETGYIVLGDMVISLPRVQAQGQAFGHGAEQELCYLTVHSVLHLLGYDHLDEGPEKKRMRAREKAIMLKLGFQNID